MHRAHLKYWTSNDKAVLRYESNPRQNDINFAQVKQWSKDPVVVKNIDQNKWGQLNFFVGQNETTGSYDAFTTAFKDVRGLRLTSA